MANPDTQRDTSPFSAVGTRLPGGDNGSGTEPSPETGAAEKLSAFDLWLHRITVLMFVFVCATAGVLLIILPWRPEWTDNHLLLRFPALRAVVANGFVRGLCNGLGVLDIWIGFWEAVHYHE